MKNYSTLAIVGLAMLASLALTSCQAAKEPQAAQVQQPPQHHSLASKLLPQSTRARSSRSISDMFEKVKSKIFGSKKQSSSASQVQPAASVSAAQRQPWGDLNSLNQQYSPYSPLGSSYQWPSSAGGQYLSQQYNPLSGYLNSQSAASPSGYSSMAGAQSQQSPSLISGLDVQSQQQQAGALNPAANSNGAANGGLLSSASQLIAQYLSPSSGSVASNGAQQSQPGQQVNGQAIGQQQSLLSPQQQQQQTQYNEFASILDSMVAQTGASSQRQPSMSQFLANSAGQQQQPTQGGYQPQSGVQGYQSAPGNMVVGDQDMSASSNVQSYMPATQQQASQKSSMVGLAEQLAPGAQFNKLVSFPFSLTNNDDSSKDGRYKLHIPFLNSHVKRSDQQQQQQQVAGASASQQQQLRAQQYLNSYAQQQQQQQPMMAQASQLVPTIVSPQSSSSSSQGSPVVASAQSSAVGQQAAPQSSSSSVASAPSSSSAVAAQSQSANSRPSWSVAELQSSSSNSKLIPMPSAASSSLDSTSQS